MKKYLTFVFMLAGIIILAGCASDSSTPDQQETKDYKVSASFWKSTNGGITWESKNITHTKPSMTDWDIIRIEVDPNDQSLLYAGLKSGGLVKSIDGGETWEFTNFISGRPYAIEIDPSRSQTIYASGIWQKRGKLFKTEDQGETWKEIYTSPADDLFIGYSAMDKNNPKVLYIGTTDQQLLKSADGGNSWTSVYRTDSSVLKIALDKFDTSLVYVLTVNGTVLRSRDAGKTFENISKKIGAAGIKVLEIDPTEQGKIYIGGNSGIFRSKNGGDNWEKVNTLNDPGRFPVTALAVNPLNAREIVYATSQTTYHSVDDGNSWVTFQFNLSKYINVIKYNPEDPDIVYLGFRQ